MTSSFQNQLGHSSALQTPHSTATTSAPTTKLLTSDSANAAGSDHGRQNTGVATERWASPSRENTELARYVSVSNSALDTSLVSATSLYRTTPFIDLLTVLDSANTSEQSS